MFAFRDVFATGKIIGGNADEDMLVRSRRVLDLTRIVESFLGVFLFLLLRFLEGHLSFFLFKGALLQHLSRRKSCLFRTKIVWILPHVSPPLFFLPLIFPNKQN